MVGTWGLALALAERASSHFRVPRMVSPDGVPRIGMRLQGDGIARGMDQGGVTFGRWYYVVLESIICIVTKRRFASVAPVHLYSVDFVLHMASQVSVRASPD